LSTVENSCDRAQRYIEKARKALQSVNIDVPESGLTLDRLLDAVRRYVEDADYYLGTGDCDTALVSVSYAEGLLDSLKYLGLTEPRWDTVEKKPKVFVAGTFELIHPGHISLLEYASRFGEVHVVVARDRNVVRFKGRKPLIPENDRLAVVRAIRYVRSATLGDEEDVLASVGRIRPDVILLGPDQPYEEDELARIVENKFGFKPLVMRYKAKKEFAQGLRSVSGIYERVCREICSGEAPRH